MKQLSSKRLISYGILALAFILGALMVYGVIAYPTKQPYRDARAAYTTVYNANVAFTQRGLSLNTSGATDEQFTANIKATKEALETLKADTKTLGEQKTLQEGEGKEKYDAFAKQLEKYAAYNEATLTSIEVLRPILLNCSVAMSNQGQTSQGNEALRRCAENLRANNDEKATPSADYRTMAASFAGVYEAIASATSNDEREFFMTELNKVNTEFSKNLSKSKAAVDITETAKSLEDYLKAKSRLFF